MLAPALLTGTGAIDWTTVAGETDIGVTPPGAGDVLSAMRARSGSEGVGVDGRLPEADELSAALLADADDPSSFEDDLGPFDELPEGPLGIPGVMLEAYMRAEERLAVTKPGCNLDWALLAGIGRIESGHARGGAVDARGNTASPILGPQLNGSPGVAVIRDTDGGRFDYDTVYDRAVGPMQFIPSTWAGYAADGNDDGQSNPNNIYDATVGAGNYLCAGGGDLSNPTQRAQAVFRYNQSNEYVSTVLFWANAYAEGVNPLPSLPGSDDDFVEPEPTNPGGSTPNNPSDPNQPSSPTSPTSPTTSTTTSTTTTTPTTTTTTTTTKPTCPTTVQTSSTTSTSTSTSTTTTTTTTTTPNCPTLTTSSTTTTTTTTTTAVPPTAPATQESSASSGSSTSSSMKPA
jgi:outer membrane biosynthesis protein TonB